MSTQEVEQLNSEEGYVSGGDAKRECETLSTKSKTLVLQRF
ncbi:hypothetical protein [Bacillus cereus]|nr:hypothetical protein [Bacillus cereus]